MNDLAIWKTLAWKEWHEHKWKLVAILGVLFGATSLAMLLVERDKFGLASGMMSLCVVPLAVFVGLGIASSERSRNTLDFLQAQPFRLWQVALMKLIMATVTLILAIASSALLLRFWQIAFDWLGVAYHKGVLTNGPAGRVTGSFYVDITIYVGLLAVSVLIWAAATGNNRKDEISAGAYALSIIAAWSLFLFLLYAFLRPLAEQMRDWAFLGIMSLVPGGFLTSFNSPFTQAHLVGALCLAGVLHLALATWYVLRFGRSTTRSIRSPKTAVRNQPHLDWLGTPRESPWTAIAWKQFRDSVPIAAVGLVAIIAIALGISIADGRTQSFAHVYSRISIPIGFFVALVIGIGVVLPDITPQANAFWRSRPIDPNLWFWTKFATGLLVLTAIIGVPFLLVTGLGTELPYENALGPFLIVTVVYLAVYAAAVAMTCLVRHAVYAAILGMGSIMMFIVVAWCIRMIPVWFGITGGAKKVDIVFAEDPEVSVAVIGIVACFVINTFLAWQATQRDWGLKSRF